MEENKKSGFLKNLLSRGQDEDSQEETSEEMETEETGKETSKPSKKIVQEEMSIDEIMQQNKVDAMYHLYCKWCAYQGSSPTQKLFSEWVKAPVVADINEMDLLSTVFQKAEIFRKQMVTTADKILRPLEAAEEEEKKQKEMLLENPEAEFEPVQVPPDVDATVHVQVTVGNMEAFVVVLPPFGNGAELDSDIMEQALAEAEVVSGLRNDVIQKIVEQKQYFKMFLVAIGTPAIAGEDGKIIEHIPREQPLTFKEDEFGRVDYKEQNLFRKIEEGDLICDIIPPEDGTDGVDIKGNAIKATPGKNAKVPGGTNTAISEDGSKLVAACSGYVTYEVGKFRIADKLVIKGNIDMSVGNQDFLGDIIVFGDVISGFTLKATGNISVQGAVEGAILDAGENIEIGDGMNGNNFGELHAGGYVRSSFLENVKVIAKDDIHVESMIGCEAHSDNDICIDEGIGVLIGGTLTAGRSVRAKIIGSKARRRTEIILGVNPELQEERREKEEQLKQAEDTRDLLEKNLQLLESTAKAGGLNEEQSAVLKQLEEQAELYNSMVDEMQEQVDEVRKRAIDYSECVVNCGTVFPPTRITIADSVYTVDTVITGNKFYCARDGEIKLAATDMNE